MLRVGLTGSIGVGKSFVLKRFADLGCHTSDADWIARVVVEPGSEGLSEVVAEFGREILDEQGSLDRTRLGSIVFANSERRLRLNEILHPLIIRKQNEMLDGWSRLDPQGIGIIEAALMIESGGYRRFDKIIVVHCAPEIQVERLMQRNSLTRLEAEKRIAAQMNQNEKMRFADYLIDTSGDQSETLRLTNEIHLTLRALASSGHCETNAINAEAKLN